MSDWAAGADAFSLSPPLTHISVSNGFRIAVMAVIPASGEVRPLVDYTDDSASEGVAEWQWVADQIKVGPLTERVEMEQIYEIFSSFGELVDIEIQQRGGRRFALARYREEAEAKEAVRLMDGGSIDMQQILVCLCLSRVEVGNSRECRVVDCNDNTQDKNNVDNGDTNYQG